MVSMNGVNVFDGDSSISASSSSNELLLELEGSEISFNVDCSGSEESNSIELLSVESFHVHGELPRHSDAV